MSLTHKPGSDSGIDFGLIGVMLLWVVAGIVILVLLVVRGHAADSPEVLRPYMR